VRRRYGLSQERIDAIVLPAPPKPTAAAQERQAKAGSRGKAKASAGEPACAATPIFSLMTSSIDALSRAQLCTLLVKLAARVSRLQAAAAVPPVAAEPPLEQEADEEAGAKRNAPSAAKRKAPSSAPAPRYAANSRSAVRLSLTCSSFLQAKEGRARRAGGGRL